MSKFTNRAIVRIIRIQPELEQWELELFMRDFARKEKLGWSLDDVVAYACCSEEVNPELSEDEALSRAKRISDKYDSDPFAQPLEDYHVG